MFNFVFSPYLAIYLIAAAFKLSVAFTLSLFIVLHVLTLGVISYLFFLERKKLTFPVLLFFLGLTALFLIPGVYLEFPSDPWEHYRRILSWEFSGSIRDNPIWTKFSYFFGYSLLGNVDSNSLSLNLYSAFWQLLLSIQFYRLAFKLFQSQPFAMLQVLGVLVLFGHNVHSFRYYALSSTPLAFCAFLELALLALSNQFTVLQWILGLLLIVFNHTQELLLLGVFTLGLFLYRKWNKSKVSVPRLFLFFTLTILSTWAFLKWTPLSSWVNHGWLNHERIYDPFTRGYISKIGTFRLWNIPGHYFQTLGVHGIASLCLALLYFKKNPLLSTLTLLPVALCLFPPFVLILTSLTEVSNTYRVLYAFPTSFMLVYALFDMSSRYIQSNWKWTVAVGLVLLVGLNSHSPWLGRLRFQLEKVSPTHNLSVINPLIDWVRTQNRSFGKNCRILADNMTSFYLNARLGLISIIPRNYPSSFFTQHQATLDLDVEMLLNHHRFCMIILPKADSVPQDSLSWVTLQSKHWQKESQSFTSQAPPEQFKKALLKRNMKWKILSAPPFHEVLVREDCPWAGFECLK